MERRAELPMVPLAGAEQLMEQGQAGMLSEQGWQAWKEQLPELVPEAPRAGMSGSAGRPAGMARTEGPADTSARRRAPSIIIRARPLTR